MRNISYKNITTSSSLAAVLVVGLVLVLGVASAFTSSAYADDRSSGERDRGVTGRAPALVPLPIGPALPLTPPASAGGSISNSTGGTADSGGNQGGDIV